MRWVMVGSTILLWHNISLYHVLLNFSEEAIHFWQFLSVKFPIVCIESTILELMRCWTTHIWGKQILKRNPTSTCKFPTFTRTNPFLITHFVKTFWLHIRACHRSVQFVGWKSFTTAPCFKNTFVQPFAHIALWKVPNFNEHSGSHLKLYIHSHCSCLGTKISWRQFCYNPETAFNYYRGMPLAY